MNQINKSGFGAFYCQVVDAYKSSGKEPVSSLGKVLLDIYQSSDKELRSHLEKIDFLDKKKLDLLENSIHAIHSQTDNKNAVISKMRERLLGGQVELSVTYLHHLRERLQKADMELGQKGKNKNPVFFLREHGDRLVASKEFSPDLISVFKTRFENLTMGSVIEFVKNVEKAMAAGVSVEEAVEMESKKSFPEMYETLDSRAAQDFRSDVVQGFKNDLIYQEQSQKAQQMYQTSTNTEMDSVQVGLKTHVIQEIREMDSQKRGSFSSATSALTQALNHFVHTAALAQLLDEVQGSDAKSISPKMVQASIPLQSKELVPGILQEKLDSIVPLLPQSLVNNPHIAQDRMDAIVPFIDPETYALAILKSVEMGDCDQHGENVVFTPKIGERVIQGFSKISHSQFILFFQVMGEKKQKGSLFTPEEARNFVDKMMNAYPKPTSGVAKAHHLQDSQDQIYAMLNEIQGKEFSPDVFSNEKISKILNQTINALSMDVKYFDTDLSMPSKGSIDHPDLEKCVNTYKKKHPQATKEEILVFQKQLQFTPGPLQGTGNLPSYRNLLLSLGLADQPIPNSVRQWFVNRDQEQVESFIKDKFSPQAFQNWQDRYGEMKKKLASSHQVVTPREVVHAVFPLYGFLEKNFEDLGFLEEGDPVWKKYSDLGDSALNFVTFLSECVNASSYLKYLNQENI